MTAIRDTLCKLRPIEIPRPKCAGLQFVSTRGRLGFYQSIKRDGAKYGIQIKNQSPRRPSLPDPWINSNNNNESSNNLNYSVQQNVIPDNLSIASTSLNGTAKINEIGHPNHDYNGNYQTVNQQNKTQAVIPEEPEDDYFEEPHPDYEVEDIKRNPEKLIIKLPYTEDQIAQPISNPPSPPPLPSLNFNKTSLKKSKASQKATILTTIENNNKNDYKKMFNLKNDLQKSNFYLRQCQDMLNEKLKFDKRMIKTKF